MNDNIDTKVKENIRELYKDSPIAKSFLNWCAERQKDARETRIERICSILGEPRPEAVTLAKQLEAAGCGEFVVGRRGSPSRFVWKYSRISLGRIALGEADEIEEWIDPIAEDEEPVTNGDPEPSSEKGLTIAQAKTRLAASLGVEPSQIEINIRA